MEGKLYVLYAELITVGYWSFSEQKAEMTNQISLICIINVQRPSKPCIARTKCLTKLKTLYIALLHVCPEPAERLGKVDNLLSTV